MRPQRAPKSSPYPCPHTISVPLQVDRWRKWMVNSHTLQARLHDIGLTVGGSVATPVDLETRKGLFSVYRHLNVIHALCYKIHHPALRSKAIEPEDLLVRLGLLTGNELRGLMPMELLLYAISAQGNHPPKYLPHRATPEYQTPQDPTGPHIGDPQNWG